MEYSKDDFLRMDGVQLRTLLGGILKGDQYRLALQVLYEQKSKNKYF